MSGGLAGLRGMFREQQEQELSLGQQAVAATFLTGVSTGVTALAVLALANPAGVAVGALWGATTAGFWAVTHFGIDKGIGHLTGDYPAILCLIKVVKWVARIIFSFMVANALGMGLTLGSYVIVNLTAFGMTLGVILVLGAIGIGVMRCCLRGAARAKSAAELDLLKVMAAVADRAARRGSGAGAAGAGGAGLGSVEEGPEPAEDDRAAAPPPAPSSSAARHLRAPGGPFEGYNAGGAASAAAAVAYAQRRAAEVLDGDAEGGSAPSLPRGSAAAAAPRGPAAGPRAEALAVLDASQARLRSSAAASAARDAEVQAKQQQWKEDDARMAGLLGASLGAPAAAAAATPGGSRARVELLGAEGQPIREEEEDGEDGEGDGQALSSGSSSRAESPSADT